MEKRVRYSPRGEWLTKWQKNTSETIYRISCQHGRKKLDRKTTLTDNRLGVNKTTTHVSCVMSGRQELHSATFVQVWHFRENEETPTLRRQDKGLDTRVYHLKFEAATNPAGSVNSDPEKLRHHTSPSNRGTPSTLTRDLFRRTTSPTSDAKQSRTLFDSRAISEWQLFRYNIRKIHVNIAPTLEIFVRGSMQSRCQSEKGKERERDVVWERSHSPQVRIQQPLTKFWETYFPWASLLRLVRAQFDALTIDRYWRTCICSLCWSVCVFVGNFLIHFFFMTFWLAWLCCEQHIKHYRLNREVLCALRTI